MMIAANVSRGAILQTSMTMVGRKFHPTSSCITALTTKINQLSTNFSSAAADADASSGNNTYYDSQSGLHVPVHNEQEISVFFNLIRERTREIPSNGIQGLIVQNFDQSTRNEPPFAGFRLFSYELPSSAIGEQQKTEYNSDRKGDDEQLILPFAEIQRLKELNDLHGGNFMATFELNDPCFEQESIEVANEVATAIDACDTCRGDSPMIWLNHSANTGPDDVIPLCEELLYLDLPGSPVKARLLANAMVNNSDKDSELVDELMMLGVNKFVVTQERQIEMIREVAQEQGKYLLDDNHE